MIVFSRLNAAKGKHARINNGAYRSCLLNFSFSMMNLFNLALPSFLITEENNQKAGERAPRRNCIAIEPLARSGRERVEILSEFCQSFSSHRLRKTLTSKMPILARSYTGLLIFLAICGTKGKLELLLTDIKVHFLPDIPLLDTLVCFHTAH